MISERTDCTLQSIGHLSNLAAEMDGITSYVKIPKRVKWSEELRRERVRLFGKSGSGSAGKKETKQDKYTEALPMPRNVLQAPDVWPYIAKLTEYIENKTGASLPALFAQKRTAERHYVKAFIVIMRYGFGIKRSIITEQIGTTKKKIDSVLCMYRDALYYSPNFKLILDELTEQLARF